MFLFQLFAEDLMSIGTSAAVCVRNLADYSQYYYDWDDEGLLTDDDRGLLKQLKRLRVDDPALAWLEEEAGQGKELFIFQLSLVGCFLFCAIVITSCRRSNCCYGGVFYQILSAGKQQSGQASAAAGDLTPLSFLTSPPESQPVRRVRVSLPERYLDELPMREALIGELGGGLFRLFLVLQTR